MIASRRRTSLSRLGLALLVAGCATSSVDLQRVARHTGGEAVPVLGSVPAPILRRGVNPFQLREIYAGRRLVEAAAKDAPEVQNHLQARGWPDAIAVQDDGRRVVFLYAPSKTAYVFAATSAAGSAAGAPPSRGLVRTRIFAEAELPVVARADFTPEIKRAMEVEAAGAPRTWAVLLRLLRAVPTQTTSGTTWGFDCARANPWVLAALGLPYETTGVVVISVVPGGPSDGALQKGDLIVGVDGMVVTRPEDLVGSTPGKKVVLSYVRDGSPGEASIQPLELPLLIDLDYVSGDTPFAGVVNRKVVVTSRLEKDCDDDMLAFILAHELGHITSNHTPGLKNNSAAGNVARVLMAPIFFVPIAGGFASSTIDGFENRYNHEQEFEADRLAVYYSVQAGFDPEGGVRATRYLEGQSPKLTAFEQFRATHPSYDDRLEAIERLSAELCPTRPCAGAK